ncbi:anaerobic ribonucleoside-triphosphate reductase activating protein [Candidatus Peregrinibacteria bacterium]|nr:anaerobic ribonucleoside-triphosphate reductase activating protein [Candidatus Peregrinibacteria bacterium]
MLIGGFQKLTLLDYPGHLAAIIFTAGCNMRCGHCYNAEFVLPEKIKKIPLIKEKDVIDVLETRKKFLEGVVISGGEPTLQPDLEDFIKKLKNMKYKVKLDTNGLRPKILKKLFQNGLLDYIAMDLKSSFEKYAQIAGVSIDTSALQESIKIIMNSGVDYEFRTTVIPKYHDEAELEKMLELISGAKSYALQQFIPKNTLDPEMEKEKSFNKKMFDAFAAIAKKHVSNVEVRV